MKKLELRCRGKRSVKSGPPPTVGVEVQRQNGRDFKDFMSGSYTFTRPRGFQEVVENSLPRDVIDSAMHNAFYLLPPLHRWCHQSDDQAGWEVQDGVRSVYTSSHRDFSHQTGRNNGGVTPQVCVQVDVTFVTMISCCSTHSPTPTVVGQEQRPSKDLQAACSPVHSCYLGADLENLSLKKGSKLSTATKTTLK